MAMRSMKNGLLLISSVVAASDARQRFEGHGRSLSRWQRRWFLLRACNLCQGQQDLAALLLRVGAGATMKEIVSIARRQRWDPQNNGLQRSVTVALAPSLAFWVTIALRIQICATTACT